MAILISTYQHDFDLLYLWSNGKGLEGLGDHEGTEVGTADANVDDVGDCLAGVALPGARDHAGTEILKNKKGMILQGVSEKFSFF